MSHNLAATFEQAFAELPSELNRATATGDEVRRLDALAYAFDKLPQLDRDRPADLLLKAEALACLALFAAEELRAASERDEVARRLNLDLDTSPALLARDAHLAALQALAPLCQPHDEPEGEPR
jgi:hypothetical protein